MCGIAGIINLRGEKTLQAVCLHKMAEQMKKRGPDDEGFVFIDTEKGQINTFLGDKTSLNKRHIKHVQSNTDLHVSSAYNLKSNIALGHRRLSIVDLSFHGHQPMSDSTGRLWIVYNGEIYNHKEIRQKLINLGHKFIGCSDTEVLLQSFIEWGIACLHEFNGMFAFAIYDNHTKEIFIARDRIGIKPFYYTVQDGQFIFASDIKTIIASGLYKAEINWEGLWHNLSLGVAPRPMTTFKDVFSLEQAHWMKLDMYGKIVKERYWDIPIGTQDFTMSEGDAIELLEQELIKSVKYRLRADVEVGTFMSGGIDSTLISAIASTLHPGIKAFTLGFDKSLSEFNEIDQASETAKMQKMEHIIKIVNPEDIISNIDDIVLIHEEPYYAISPNYTISKFVSENNIKVVLNGLGGDELFAGYSYYNKSLNLWKKIKKFEFLLKFLPYSLNRRLNLLKEFSRIKKIDDFYLFHHSVFKEREKELLFKNWNGFNTPKTFSNLYNADNKKFTDDIEALSYYDIMSYIGNHHVYRVDQFTMNFSIEGRFPFLDHNLIQAAFKIPTKFKIKDGLQKYILRKVAEKYIAASCLKMKKKGFSFPLKYWMNNNKKLREIKKESISMLKTKGLFRLDSRDLSLNYQQTWHLVMVYLWMNKLALQNV